MVLCVRPLAVLTQKAGMPEHTLCWSLLHAAHEQHQRIKVCVTGNVHESVLLIQASCSNPLLLQAKRLVGRVV